MASLLIIEDDPAARKMFAEACTEVGFAVATADTGGTGIRLLEDIQPQITLIDVVLPDMSGLEILKHISLAGIETNAVVMTGVPSTRCAVEAIRLGACEFIEKPVAIDELLRLMVSLLRPGERRARAAQPTSHAALRVATIIVKTIESRRDPRTIEAWARFVGASPGAIRSWCRAARVSAKHSLDLARLLRAVVWSGRTDVLPECLLDVVDPRTLDKLLRVGDETNRRDRLPATIDELLSGQRWIQDPEIVAAIRRATQRLVRAGGQP